LSGHALLIAAIFVPYILLMVGLGYYIYRTGQPRRPRDQDDAEDPGPVVLPMAA
jgi:hypothetical protein